MGIRTEAKLYRFAGVGAIAEHGIFNISYRGHVIGSAATQRASVAPASHSVVWADVKVDRVPTVAGMLMLQDITNNNTQLPVEVDGSLLAIAGPFRVHCKVHCDLVTDVSALPVAKFTHKKCTYAYMV
mmetsp:Transcript_120148/g.299745  ORF Transcript_120148/g.299745 Transcript_120148/m.299745 type:complete len:128 (-) Transcript_120148:144-527(-)